MKRILSFILALAIILGAIPINDLVVFAADGDPVFNSVVVNKVFKDLYGVEKYSILITGDNFTIDGQNRVEVGIMGGDGTIKAFTPTYTSKTMLQYELKPDEVAGNLFIDGQTVDISEDNMPFITNKTPTTGMVDSTGDAKITLTGSGFDKLSDTLKASLFQGNSKLPIPKGASGTELESTALKGKTGTWSIEFEKKDEISNLKKKDGSPADFTISHRYMNMFSMINKLDVSDKIDLIPTQGTVESTAMLQADNLKPTNEMSVFFLKNLDDPYLASHMATNENHRKDDKLKKEIFSFTIPKALTPGSYYVVLTNEVDPTKDIKSQIKSYKVLETKFIVIDRKNMVVIDSIDPNKGSSKGIDATIKGINIARISPEIYEIGERKSVDINSNTNKMVVEYSGGIYKMIGENGVKVENLTREIKFIIGGEVTFRAGYELDEAVYDYINVRVGENYDSQKLVYDVIAEITTTIEYEDENGDKKTTEIFETHTLKDGFTYEALDYVPKITSIVPDKIPVDTNFNAMEGLKVAIIGENFLLYRYKDSEGNIRYKYPKFDFGGQFSIDPNDENIEMKILDKQGTEIDGTEGNDLGTKILLTIPANKKVKEDILNTQLDLKITNPIRVPDSQDTGSSATYKFQFIKPEGDKIPFITNVNPDTVTTSGEKGVIIRGQNFAEKFTLYMDGEKITTAKRNGTGTEITFDAPPKAEGYVQLIVQNDDGALAVFDKFLYVKTYTDPKITDFNPKKGTAHTLVNLKGQNLVPPNPLVNNLDGIGFMKLIGTRVLIGGKDINTYTTDNQLKPYTTPAENLIISAKDGVVTPSDYYHSIILEDSGVYYKIYFDTVLGKYYLTDGDKDVYEIIANGSKLYAKKGGDSQIELDISREDIKIGGRTLTIKTPYATETVEGVDTITGNKVKVLNSGELYFEMPPQPREGYYDVTIVNPDTKKDSKTGNNGFYYSFKPDYNLAIESIQPNEGSVDGGYYITITRDKTDDKDGIERKFIDNGGDNKTSVFIGGVKVDPKDVEISIDRNSIIVKVPKYPGDLSTETEMDRKTVPVVVVNPDGGSGKKEDGFSYILPISYPKISNIIEKEGSAAGDITVYIEGSEFRFYEPYRDLNNDLIWNLGEPFTDLNEDGEWTDLRGKKMEEVMKNEKNKKILPRIYFGGQLATIVSFTSTMIEVKTPKGQAGTVDVYLINNDQGISNKVNYTYKASSPKITNVSPSVGKKQGGDKVEILGEGFTTSNIRVYKSTSIPTGRETLQLVQFGDSNNKSVSNKGITSTDDKNTGNFSENRTKDIEIGNLTVKYENNKLTVSLTEGVGDTKVVYENTFDYDMEEIFLPINLLKDSDGNSYSGNELVRIKVERLPGASTTSRLRIDRGFSPNATLKNGGHINIITPNYYTVGKVPVTVINPDGGEAKGEFEYKNPDSKPEITNILKDGEPGYSVDDGRTIIEVNYLGGNVIEVQGRDFRKPVKIEIGDIKINVPIEYEPDETISNTLRFTMPAVDSKYINTYHKLKVINEDGGTCDSDKIEIRFIMPEVTGLQITKVTPNFGPTSGGTVITIEGKDFREQIDNRGELKVYITKGNKQIRVPKEDIISISIDKIVLRTPAYEAGPVGIKVENPDGGIAELKDAFTYVSNPKISSIVSPEDDRRIIETISIEGGEKIKILGSDFMEGARVVFVPNLRKLTDKEEATDYITIGADRYVIEGGVDGTEIEVVDGQTILVTTPAGKLGDKGVIVINPDRSATNIYNIIYGIPETSAPLDVRAEVVFDQFIRVFWTGVEEAFEYEIYVSEDGGKFEFIGSTELTSYSVQKIKPNTKYQFLVRAIGKYGTSKPIKESQSNIVTTGKDVGPKDTDGKLGENTVINRNGTEASIIIGSKDFTSKGMTIDLTRGELQGVKDISIRIPANIIVNSTGKIIVIGKDYNMNFNPNVFKNSTITSNKDNSNAGVVFKILTHKGSIDAKAGNTVLGTAYSLEGNIYVGKDIQNIEYLSGNIIFSLEHDMLKAQSRRLNNIQTVRYDNGSKSWINIQGVSRLGIYTVIGSRR